MIDAWIWFFGGACTLHCGWTLARLLCAGGGREFRARDASGRTRLLRIDRRRANRGRRVLDRRRSRALDYAFAADSTTQRLRPARFAA